MYKIQLFRWYKKYAELLQLLPTRNYLPHAWAIIAEQMAKIAVSTIYNLNLAE